ncbi:hypothetical protein EVAR_15122_1 [Eumeta japonica]|uniref:Pre-C2HC domain-containing protein n=1 Tax=Eumeta variegata TaxID=151549 RepID=A0A4C1UIF3_EUMVA|nr:hypothetical protein EVAR_15122_1 [Eumeta japonica]
MDSQRLKLFLSEHGDLDLLRDFEAYCASPASPDQPDFEPEMKIDIPIKESFKRLSESRLSEETNSDSWSDDSIDVNDSEEEEFTLVSRRKPRRPRLCASGLAKLSGKKPKASTSAPPAIPSPVAAAPTTPAIKHIYYSAPWRSAGKPISQDVKTSKTSKPSQPTKAAKSGAPTAPTVTFDEADDIVPPAPIKSERPSPLFIRDKGRWSEIRKQCDSKSIVILKGRNSIKGLKKPATVTDYRNLSALLATLKVAYHTYSLKEEREFRVVLRGVPKKIPIEEVKDQIAQDLPVQSVRRITNRAREPLDLVLLTADTGIDTATKRSFYRIKAVCSLSGIKVEQPHKKSIPGQCFNCELYGHSSKNRFQRARYIKCLGDYGTAAYTRNKDTDGAPACALCKSSGHTADYLGCPRAPKRKIIHNNNFDLVENLTEMTPLATMQLKRDQNTCIVKCTICPEHKVRSKPYAVSVVVNEAEESVTSVQCHDCPRRWLQARCRILMWLHRRTEDPSCTSVECYWRKSNLAKVGSSIKVLTASEISKRKVRNIIPDNSVLKEFVQVCKKRKIKTCQFLRHEQDFNHNAILSLHHLMMNNGHENCDDFLKNISIFFNKNNISAMEKQTRGQDKSSMWHELRYGRITASKCYEVSRCKTVDGTLIAIILGARIPETSAILRGKKLEDKVRKTVEKIIGNKIDICGLYISEQFPMIAGSPDESCKLIRAQAVVIQRSNIPIRLELTTECIFSIPNSLTLRITRST